ncbi:sulfotransferase family protein [Rubrivirga sp. IMCC45206]|uniref:sulfotransferase family protein n=1 Tax=Rubrivirga sp. IMCC45206 TaxID=3391614 RepID=UPI00398FA230
MALPTFLVVGAPKAGTTALWHHLVAHPEVEMATVKEPRFWTREPGGLVRGDLDDRMPRAGTFDKGLAWYQALWTGSAPARGEASTVYLAAPDAPSLVAEHLPGARVVAVLRDPVERMHSHYWQERRAGWAFGTFAEMVEAGHPRARYFEAASHYREALDRWRAAVGEERMLVLTHDALAARPAETVARVYRFLGVDAAFVPDTLGRRYNRQQAAPAPALMRRLERLRALADGRLPAGLVRLAGRVRRAVVRRAATPGVRTPLDPALRARLVPRFLEDIAAAEAWTGEPLGAWRRTDG